MAITVENIIFNSQFQLVRMDMDKKLSHTIALCLIFETSTYIKFIMYNAWLKIYWAIPLRQIDC